MKTSFMHPDQLAALDAIATHGTFEAAARSLGVSTSAVSQRVRALEASLGRIPVRPGPPATRPVDGAGLRR
ncbi:LysR family transcriptional regulator, partial [Actinomyces radicidentis]|uniref:LysR family transcriptional regulator n=1 Tax=Actinomyces radicidentis TaxID=111015 RepID=UPI0026E0C197